MVNGLIKYHKLGQAIILLKGFGEDFSFSKTDRQSMAEWNPLLLAIAFKRLDIVRYFLHELMLSLRLTGVKAPINYEQLPEDKIAEEEIFSLTIAVANKDTPMLQELWTSNSSAWEF
jgi:hypothetical protein